MERYSLEKAQNEAEILQKKIMSGEATTYSEAEKQLEQGKQGEEAKTGIVDSVNELLPLKNPDLANTVRVTDLVSDGESIHEIIDEESKAEEDGISDAGFAVYMLSDFDRNPAYLEKVKPYFEGKIVVDIGAGRSANGYKIAKQLGCKAYIAVEPYYAKSLMRKFSNVKDKDMPLAVTSDDALTFLKNIPDNSVSIMTFGTDGLMLRDAEYNHKLGKEIARCLSKDGAFLSSESVLVPITEDGEQEIERDIVGRGMIYHS